MPTRWRIAALSGICAILACAVILYYFRKESAPPRGGSSVSESQEDIHRPKHRKRLPKPRPQPQKQDVNEVQPVAAARSPVSEPSESSAGAIVGQVKFIGIPPPEIEIVMSADQFCEAMHEVPATTRHYVVGEEGGLANVFVYIKEGLEDFEFDLPTRPVVLNQKSCLYVPMVLGIMVGQELEIVNSDDTLHNVHATPLLNEEFNKGQPVKGMKFVHRFTTPEVMIRFKCDVHPWMFAYVGVLPHPFYTITGLTGTFRLEGLPDGQYTIEAWHPKAGAVDQLVTISDGETKTVDFEFAAGP